MTSQWMLVKAVTVVLLAAASWPLHAQPGKTFGTAGKEKTVLKAGVEAELLRHTGKGFLVSAGIKPAWSSE
jgi:hypothetical protein